MSFEGHYFFFGFLPPLGATDPRTDRRPEAPLLAGSGVASDLFARGRRAFLPI